MRILRHEVPVDDHFHELVIGEIVHVATRAYDPRLVEIWAYEWPTRSRFFVVVSTEQKYNPLLYHIATTVAPDIGLVWHLLEDRSTG